MQDTIPGARRFHKICAQLDDPHPAVRMQALHHAGQWLDAQGLRWSEIIQIPTTSDTPTITDHPTVSPSLSDYLVIGIGVGIMTMICTAIYTNGFGFFTPT